MPNWCANNLVIEHEDPEMISRAQQAFENGTFLNEFIPCPEGQDWFMFNVGNWGTKWDVGDPEGVVTTDTNRLHLQFDSAWSPPIEAYQRLEEMGFKIDAMYFEPGVGFAGIYRDGDDDHYDLTGFDSERARIMLPKELDEEFGISESLDWDDE